MNTTEMILQKIKEKNKIHANNLESFWATCDEPFKELAENYLSSYCSFLEKNFTIGIDFIVDSYLMMVKDITIEQTRFKRDGKYRYSTIQEADENVYSNSSYMFQYMIGVALSQFFWKNHKEMFEFFKKHIRESTSSKRYLEVGCGHGLFFLESTNNPSFESYKAVDISPTSLDITTKIVKSYFGGTTPKKISFENQDITKADVDTFGHYDFITMGEVLEHVEDPKSLLRSIYNLLSSNGKAYISTCANCPVRDHIFLYSSIDQIRKDIVDCNFKILDELIISNDNIPEQEWLSKKSNLSYAAILQKDLE